ncbi:hypothetical protein K4E_17970 [Enterococcus thailandicus]|nr:hypothetical protein K4E_17970 [Enterococcus thailandicus]
MDKKLYYRVMGPTVVLAALVLFIPNFSIRSLVGFLIMFSGLGMYYRLLLHCTCPRYSTVCILWVAGV